MLVATNLIKNYKFQNVLNGVSLTIKDGEFVSIMGESGSGKSTLLSILAGNTRADSGSVMIDGKDICHFNEEELATLRRETIGFVYQSLNLIPTLSAEENILLPSFLSSKDAVAARKKMTELAGELEIEHLLKKMPDDMSGGERQRVAIARALINDPKIIMLDEPTGSLDSRTTREVLNLLSRINKQYGVTIIQVTHSLDAATSSDRIIKICDGQVIE